MTSPVTALSRIEEERVKERPILFSGPMVRAILEGRKTQTRRAVKPAVVTAAGIAGVMRGTGPAFGPSPYGEPGDTLWGRETWQYADWTEDGYPYIRYRADGATILHDTVSSPEWGERLSDIWSELSAPENYAIDNRAADRRWRPSIFLPRWACRINLTIDAVRVERLQDIGWYDSKAEGLNESGGLYASDGHRWQMDPRAAYRDLWESINGIGSWDANPWVWVVTFSAIRRLSGQEEG